MYPESMHDTTCYLRSKPDDIVAVSNDYNSFHGEGLRFVYRNGFSCFIGLGGVRWYLKNYLEGFEGNTVPALAFLVALDGFDYVGGATERGVPFEEWLAGVDYLCEPRRFLKTKAQRAAERRRHWQQASKASTFFLYQGNGDWAQIPCPCGTYEVVICDRPYLARSLMESDEEYFCNYPELPFRLKLRVVEAPRCGHPLFFWFEITTITPSLTSDGDSGDIGPPLRHDPGTPRERVIRACLLMLTGFRSHGGRRIDQYFDQKVNHEMTNAELWPIALRAIGVEAEYSAMI